MYNVKSSDKNSNKDIKLGIIINAIDERYFPIIKRNIELVNFLVKEYNFNLKIVLIIIKNRVLKKMLSKITTTSNVRLFFTDKNINLAKGRNIGIKLCDSDWLLFIDDDVLLNKKYLIKLINLIRAIEIRKISVVAITGNAVPYYINFKNKKYILKPPFKELYWLIGCTYFATNKKIKMIDRLIGSNMAIKRSVFDNIGLFDERLGFSFANKKNKIYIGGEDTEFALRILNKQIGYIVYNKDLICKHIVTPNKLQLFKLLRRAFYYPLSLKFVSKRINSTNIKYYQSLRSQLLIYSKYLIKKNLKLTFDSIINLDLSKISKMLYILIIFITITLGFIYSFIKDV